MQLDTIHSVIGEDLKHVDCIIAQQLGSNIELICQLSQHIVQNSGKRIRPTLVLLAANAFSYKGQQHHNLAAIIELIHTATLLHDDVVDASSLRRGQKSANMLWGNEASILVGDYLYSRSFQMMIGINNMTIMEVLANSANTIAEGEVLQLMGCKNAEITKLEYMEIIRRKTATLFEAAAQMGPILSGAHADEINAMSQYGLSLGTAFQLVDDALDYGAKGTIIGKNIGDDLREGKPTLPLIYALQNGTLKQKSIISEAIKKPNDENIEDICKVIASTNAIKYTYKEAKIYADYAIGYLNKIPSSCYRDAMVDLARFAVDRDL